MNFVSTQSKVQYNTAHIGGLANGSCPPGIFEHNNNIHPLWSWQCIVPDDHVSIARASITSWASCSVRIMPLCEACVVIYLFRGLHVGSVSLHLAPSLSLSIYRSLSHSFLFHTLRIHHMQMLRFVLCMRVAFYFRIGIIM